jgi:basic amino acid/polyamine antiporter, APA family
MSEQKYKLNTATYIVIANMIGTGVFASLFFQIDSVPSGSAILVLWLAGGIVALCGGLCYAELSGLFPRSGGEYEYLTKIYHPALGFATGICTLIVGFAAPVASSALNLGNYFAPILGIQADTMQSKIVALISVGLVTFVQLLGVETSSKFQNASTIFKIALILVFIALPFLLPNFTPSTTSFAWTADTPRLIRSGNFYSCLAFLYFSYVGWNASVYIASEVENPSRTLPLSILIGVLIVSVLYILLNFSFLYVCNFDEIRAGGSSVGNTVIAKLFGELRWGSIKVTDLFSALLSLALFATLNAYMVVAPRVAEVFGKDYVLFHFLTKKAKNNAPYIAILVMGAMTCLFVLLSNLKDLLDYVGFCLSIFASMAVLGIYIMRWKFPNAERPFKTWGYPVTPILFVGINLSVIYYSIQTLYNGHFLYDIAPNGQLIISPLSASIFTILGSIGLYFIFGKKQS